MTGFMKDGARGTDPNAPKAGVLSVSYGTTYAETRAKTIDAIDKRLAEEFPDRAFYTAWTSETIAEKLRRERDERHDTLGEAFKRIAADGVTDLIVAMSCLMQGFEAKKIAAAARQWVADARDAGEGERTLRLAVPLLATPESRRALAQALHDEFPQAEGQAVLLMGHGSKKGSNEAYVQVQTAFRDLGRDDVYMATIEGAPSFDEVAAELERHDYTSVRLAPFMIVAGDHALHDLSGDGQDSWESQLRERGFETQATLRGIGEYVGVQRLVCDLARMAEPVLEEGSDEIA